MRMYSKSLVLLLLTFIAFQVGAGISATEQKAMQLSPEEVLKENASSFERGDIRRLEQLWANDESVVVFESGHANYGWADYRDNHLVPEMKELKNTKYSFSDIRIHTEGNTAWATFQYSISADLETRHVDGSGLGTAVLRQINGEWRIIHWHSSSSKR